MLKIGHGLYTALVAVIFLGAGLLHSVRAYYEWDLILGPWAIPVWVSWLAALVLLTMSVTSIRDL